MSREIVWQASDHVHHQKGADWFWVLGILAVSTSVVAILFRNFFFALLVLVASFTLALLAKRPAKIIQFKLSSTGLFVGPTHYPWASIRTFWIHTADNSHVLLIQTTSALAPHFSIPLPSQRTEEIRTFLQERVAEEELHEPASHKIMEFFGL